MKKIAKNWASRPMMLVFWLLGWWLFKIRNKTTIIGRQNMPSQAGLLLLSNHQSLIDSLLIAYALFQPRDIFFRYHHIPYNAPAWENFFRKTSRRFFCRLLKTIPAYRRGGKNKIADNILSFEEILKSDSLLLFFEGTRSRDGQIGPCKYGPAKLIIDCQPTVVPIKIENMDKVMPIEIGFKWHQIRSGQNVTIKIGEPLIFPSMEIEEIKKYIQHQVAQL